MKKRQYILSLTVLAAAGLLITGCSRAGRGEVNGTQGEAAMTHQTEELGSTFIAPTEDITELEEGLSIVRYELDTLPLSCFPTIDKQVLLTHFDELITLPEVTQEELRKFDEEIEADRKPYNGKYHVVHSSGSMLIGLFSWDF